MQLHTLQPQHPLTPKGIRVGRGGKRGTTSGRGQKGQHAHAGRKVPSGLKELLRRLPKLRGINNRPIASRPFTVNLSALESLGPKDTTVTKELLAARGFIPHSRATVKILGDGTVTRPRTIRGCAVSAGAKKKIEAAGGKVL